MHLCFGILTSVLLACRKTKDNGRHPMVTQSQMVALLARCVDLHSSYYPSSYFFEEEFDCDVSVATKLVHCKKDFIVSSGFPEEERDMIIFQAKAEFAETVSPTLADDQKSLVVLALLDIIRKDSYIDKEKSVAFREYFGFSRADLLHQINFPFSDFLSRALLYTTRGDVDNKEPLPPSFASPETLECYLGQLKVGYQGDYRWNPTDQILTLELTNQFELFDKALDEHGILYFLECGDPTAEMDVKTFEKAKNFRFALSPYTFRGSGITACRIHRFQSAFYKYISILQIGTRPRYNEVTTTKLKNQYVPLSRGEPIFGEDVECANAFSNLVVRYRKHLIHVYSRMYAHMFFAVDEEAIEIDTNKNAEAAYPENAVV